MITLFLVYLSIMTGRERYFAVPQLNLTLYLTPKSMAAKPSSRRQAAFRLMAAGSLATALAVAGSALNGVQGAEILNITLDKTSMLRVDVPIKSVVVGRSQIADVTMESRRLLLVTGNAIGETNLTILGEEGREIASYDVVVVPETDRRVTIHRSPDTVATYSCMPRCTVVKSPDGTAVSTRAPTSKQEFIVESTASATKETGSAVQREPAAPAAGTDNR